MKNNSKIGEKQGDLSHQARKDNFKEKMFNTVTCHRGSSKIRTKTFYSDNMYITC